MVTRILLCAVLMVAAIHPAYALSIRNLSGVEQVLVMERGGSRQAITIAPNATYYQTGGDMTLTMPGQPPRQVKFEEEYVIWPDGQMILQKKQKTKGGSR